MFACSPLSLLPKGRAGFKPEALWVTRNREVLQASLNNDCTATGCFIKETGLPTVHS